MRRIQFVVLWVSLVGLAAAVGCGPEIIVPPGDDGQALAKGTASSGGSETTGDFSETEANPASGSASGHGTGSIEVGSTTGETGGTEAPEEEGTDDPVDDGTSDPDAEGTGESWPGGDTDSDAAVEDDTVPEDEIICPVGPFLDDVDAPDAGAVEGGAEDLESADGTGLDAPGRIEVNLDIVPFGPYILLRSSFYNPADCHWSGHLFFERQEPSGAVRTIARRYNAFIPSGGEIVAQIVVYPPPWHETHLFFARAYHRDGIDRRPFFNCLITEEGDDPTACSSSDTAGDALGADEELELAEEVIEATFEEMASSDLRADDGGLCDGADDPDARLPIDVDLRVLLNGHNIDVVTIWRNADNVPWWGDIYVDVIDPDHRILLLRRTLSVFMPVGSGFCTFDWMRRPVQPGLYVFYGRALRRDGSDVERWQGAGSTEITAVCSGGRCELIEPNQQRAGIILTGDGVIHLLSDFVSRFTRVKLAYGPYEFDITEHCTIYQYAAGEQSHLEVHFNTFDLPIGPRTWAEWTIIIEPAVPVPLRAKLSDALWIETNGGE